MGGEVERVSWARITQPEEPGFVMGIEAFIVHGPVDSSWAAASPRSETRAKFLAVIRNISVERSVWLLFDLSPVRAVVPRWMRGAVSLCLASTNELASDLQGHSQMVVGLPLGL